MNTVPIINMQTLKQIRNVRCNAVVNYKAGTEYKFCKNCKYYMKNQNEDYCKYYGKINLIDGKITYEYAQIARQYECKGEKYIEMMQNMNTNIGDAKGTSP